MYGVWHYPSDCLSHNRYSGKHFSPYAYSGDDCGPVCRCKDGAYRRGLYTCVKQFDNRNAAPVMPTLPIMAPELAAYGCMGGYLHHRCHLPVWAALIGAMIAGRGAAVLGAFLLVSVLNIQLSPLVYITGAVVKGLPGIALQLVIVPLIVSRLERIFYTAAKDGGISMKKKKLIIQVLLALSLGTATGFAAELPSYDMEEIIIVADAYRSPVPEDTVNVKVVSPGRAATIPELLRQSAGIDIQRRSFAGDNQDGTVKLRGYDARRYTVLLNGRQINSAGVMGGSYIDWNAIPLNTVEKIQIIKGGKLASEGNTLGGVINIVTRDKGPDGGEINILSGENSQYNYLFNYAGQAAKLRLL